MRFPFFFSLFFGNQSSRTPSSSCPILSLNFYDVNTMRAWYNFFLFTSTIIVNDYDANYFILKIMMARRCVWKTKYLLYLFASYPSERVNFGLSARISRKKTYVLRLTIISFLPGWRSEVSFVNAPLAIEAVPSLIKIFSYPSLSLSNNSAIKRDTWYAVCTAE